MKLLLPFDNGSMIKVINPFNSWLTLRCFVFQRGAIYFVFQIISIYKMLLCFVKLWPQWLPICSIYYFIFHAIEQKDICVHRKLRHISNMLKNIVCYCLSLFVIHWSSNIQILSRYKYLNIGIYISGNYLISRQCYIEQHLVLE